MLAWRFGLVLSAMIALVGCNGLLSGQIEAECGSEEARKLVDQLVKEELEVQVQGQLDSEVAIGSYDATALDNAVRKIKVTLEDIRTSRDDPDSSRLACRASVLLVLPGQVEKTANEARIMAELGSIVDVANQYKVKRQRGGFVSDFNYFVQPTDDGRKLFVEVDPDAPPIEFLSEVMTSFLMADEIRAEKIAEDREAAEAERMEREVEQAFVAEADAALNAAQVQRKLASDRIGAVWRAMPREAQRGLGALHNAWVQQMKASCAAQAAGTDERAAMRKAMELNCQAEMVQNCAATLARNTDSSNQWTYCRL